MTSEAAHGAARGARRRAGGPGEGGAGVRGNARGDGGEAAPGAARGARRRAGGPGEGGAGVRGNAPG